MTRAQYSAILKELETAGFDITHAFHLNALGPRLSSHPAS